MGHFLHYPTCVTMTPLKTFSSVVSGHKKELEVKKKHQLYNTYTIIQIIKVIMFVNIEKHIYLSIKLTAIIYTYIY